MEEISVQCFVCEKIPKYTCPRCSIHYCSLDCYKHEKHLQCSESFYKEQVITELKDMKGSPTGKRKMMEMLQRLKVENEKDKDGISERLSDVYLDDSDALWERLSTREKLMFKERVRKGNVNFLHIWKAWWESTPSSKKLPAIPQDLPKTLTLTNGKQPSEKLKYNVIEVLLAYMCVMRVYNGDLYDMSFESTELFLNLSNVLSRSYVYTDLETCLITFIQNVKERSIKLNILVDPFDLCIKQDLRYILTSDGRFIVRCISDLHERLKKLKKILRVKEEERSDDELNSNLRATIKKVYFFLVYAHEYECDIREEEHNLLRFCEKLQNEKEQFEDQKNDIDCNMDKLKPKNDSYLIEEL